MALDETRSSRMRAGLSISIILYCTACVLYPPIRHFGPLTLIYGLVLLAYFFLLIHRMKADGTGAVPLGDLYAQVKRGRRLPRDPLGTAAVVALIVSSIYLSSHGG